MISCFTSNLMHARDSLHVRWTDCMFVEFTIRRIHDSQFSCWCFCLQSSIEISCLSLLLDMRLIRDRILVTKDSYEYNENSFLVIDSWIDWFFRLKMLDTAFDEENCIEECQDRIWSIYSSWSCCIDAISRNWLM